MVQRFHNPLQILSARWSFIYLVVRCLCKRTVHSLYSSEFEEHLAYYKNRNGTKRSHIKSNKTLTHTHELRRKLRQIRKKDDKQLTDIGEMRFIHLKFDARVFGFYFFTLQYEM